MSMGRGRLGVLKHDRCNGWRVPDLVRVEVVAAADVVRARQWGRRLALAYDFSAADQTAIAAAISEVARNILMYARRGEVLLGAVHYAERMGVVVVARDEGPGIPDIERALQGGYSTSGGLGRGLAGAQRLMDELTVASGVGRGTTVTMKKWRRPCG